MPAACSITATTTNVFKIAIGVAQSPHDCSAALFSNHDACPSGTGAGVAYMAGGWKEKSDSGVAAWDMYGAPFTAGDVITVQMNMVTGTVRFYVNGDDQGVAYAGLTAGITAQGISPAWRLAVSLMDSDSQVR